MSLLTRFGRLNAGECRRGGPRVILQASFTRMQRPFLCIERAVAVERTNDARSRVSEARQQLMSSASHFNGSWRASLLTRGGYTLRSKRRYTCVPRPAAATLRKRAQPAALAKKQNQLSQGEHPAQGARKAPRYTRAATRRADRSARTKGHGRDPRRRPLGAHVRLPRRARIGRLKDLWKTHARRRRPRFRVGARLCEKVARAKAAQ